MYILYKKKIAILIFYCINSCMFKVKNIQYFRLYLFFIYLMLGVLLLNQKSFFIFLDV